MVEPLTDRVIDVRDRALLLIGFAGAMRRSEIVALDVTDVRKSRAGLTVTIRRTKTDQEAEGYEFGVPHGSNPTTCPVRAFDAWLDLAAITDGALFRSVNRHGRVQAYPLSDRDVARIVIRRLEAAGIDPQRYSGHSLRAGFITSAAEAEVEIWQIKKQSRHASDRVLHGYIRTATLFRHNAAAKVGL